MRRLWLFLRLKELDAYSYNNAAYTDLYKVQGEDQTLKRIAGSWNDPTRIRRLVSFSVSSSDRFSGRLLSLVYEEDVAESSEPGTGA